MGVALFIYKYLIICFYILILASFYLRFHIIVKM